MVFGHYLEDEMKTYAVVATGSREYQFKGGDTQSEYASLIGATTAARKLWAIVRHHPGRRVVVVDLDTGTRVASFS